MVCVANLRAHSEELAERECRHCPQRRVLSKNIWLTRSGVTIQQREIFTFDISGSFRTGAFNRDFSIYWGYQQGLSVTYTLMHILNL
jgi:hypothetical protein